LPSIRALKASSGLIMLCAEADLEAAPTPEIVAAMATPSAALTARRRENVGMMFCHIGRLAASHPWLWQRQPSRPHEPGLRPNSSPRDDIVLAPSSSSMLVF
jgi:hypothetical protein